MPKRSNLLSEEDRKHLADYNRLRELLQDRVVSVVKRYQVGVYLVGRAGVGKTHGVRAALRKQSSPYLERNTRMSCMGLWRTLAEHPDHTIMIDDIPAVCTDTETIPILLAALGGKAGERRPVTYSTRDHQKTFYFSGGVIAISNVPLQRDRLADALASRMVTMEFEPTDSMVQAFIRSEASKGYEDLSPEQCMEVAEFVIQECRNAEYPLDLRFYYKGLNDYRQDARGDSTLSWKDLLKSAIVRVVVPESEGKPKRAERIADERLIAKGLFEKYPQDRMARLEEWMHLTGKSEKALYRRYGEAQTG